MRGQWPPEDVLAEHTQQGLWEPREEDWGRTGFRGSDASVNTRVTH